MESKETIVTLHGLLIDKLLAIRTKFLKLLAIRTKFLKMLVFFKTVKECETIYKDKGESRVKFTEAPRYPDYHQFHVVDIYTKPIVESI